MTGEQATVRVVLRQTPVGTLVGLEDCGSHEPAWVSASEARVLADELVLAARDAERRDAGAWS